MQHFLDATPAILAVAAPWHAPGLGGLMHNPPGIVHARRATQVPLLAVWFLNIDEANGEEA